MRNTHTHQTADAGNPLGPRGGGGGGEGGEGGGGGEDVEEEHLLSTFSKETQYWQHVLRMYYKKLCFSCCYERGRYHLDGFY
jgi:hypothetical protein